MNINPLYPAAGDAGVLIAQVDDKTNTVMISDNGGVTFVRASAALEAILTGRTPIDVKLHDPFDGDTIENRRALDYIINYYRPDLVKHRLFRSIATACLRKAHVDTTWKQAMQDKTNCDRWDCLSESLIEHLDQNP